MFLCFISEHSLRVSTSPEMQDDLPVPGGPATMIPGEEKQTKHMYIDQKCMLWNGERFYIEKFAAFSNSKTSKTQRLKKNYTHLQCIEESLFTIMYLSHQHKKYPFTVSAID